ncbi:DUF4123 domain-containing protein [Pseudomonas sp. Ant30-3]|uniref:DUF4123 domain-containing protein n=1 Tax=Pseudomonas sp. Ant30-3 TaxID=1488328 RepID=UPI00049043FC|nr:DUF4123 domain-containing protein [Pseudomonas sp. Ant30-3]
MHVSALNALLAEPRYEFDSLPREQSSQALCFIIDRTRQPEAMSRLYRIGEPMNAQGLFIGTDFAELAADGPLWLVAPWGSQLAAEAARLCEENYSGIALVAEDATAALAHARWLLRANDGSGGQSLLSFHKPSLWAALVYTAGEASQQLFGPWRGVFSPGPVHFGEERGGWLSWPHSKLKWQGDFSAFNIPEHAPKVQQGLAWAYWVDENYEAFGKPTPEELPRIAENLDLLVNYNVYEGRHLLKLARITNGALFNAQPQAMAILQSKEESFIKVEQLRQLAMSAA